jgi:hypothetical protein
MLGILGALGGSLLKSVVPSAINWGLRKLASTNFGKVYVPPTMINGVAEMVSRLATPK